MKMNKITKTFICGGLMALALSGCGDDGKDGINGENAIVGQSIGQATSFNLDITATEINEGTVKVFFDLEDANGVPILDLTTYSGVDTLGVGIAKLVPQNGKGFKTLQWKSYINHIVQPVVKDIPEGYEDKAKAQIQATIESSCKQDCLAASDVPGQYTYTMQTNLTNIEPIDGLDLTFDNTLTHRITFELRTDGDANKLINTHFDFDPVTGKAVAAEDTRTVNNLEQSCLRCHGSDYDHSWAPKLALHGGKRIALENCQVCHNSYSADPETGSPLDFGYMVHKVHKSDYVIAGYKGGLHDYSNVTFPADMYDCQVCHQENQPKSPVDADNFKFHNAIACGSCHSKSTDPEQIKTDMHDKYMSETSCSTCHVEKGEQGAAHHFTDAVAKTNAAAAYSAKLLPQSLIFTPPTSSFPFGYLTFDVQINSKGTVVSPNEDARLSRSYLTLAFGNEQDFGNSQQRQTYDLKLKKPISVNGNTFTYKEMFMPSISDIQLAATAVITTNMCVDRDTLAGVECQQGTNEARNPAVIAGKAVPFNLAATADVKARRVVISNEACAKCHDNKYLGKFGGQMHHNGQYANFEVECQLCHNPINNKFKPFNRNSEFKVLIHSLHANKRANQDVGEDKRISYPENIGNCATCHDKGQLSMNGLDKVPATSTFDTAPVEFSPIAITCISCHGIKDSLVSHIRSNGGAANDAPGTYTPGSETCATCHAEGKSLGVDKVHPINYK
ncbi:OmcA/MtrC family decaheme c-type cytochrome [Shewanella intestini]|uniref:OmcA/MtrC family decaheme c-type cytochrome n=1 Tax=Shewanella intestini TaxID=2017544 RepID=A0ABS5I6A2_9GAMM|nr:MULTISPECIES: OmcA/MtrC family decaheme c-type cytochrome [Shewanella]MBR9729553.1 OmcA/MtrC family decaheme c-type cytochrome [Shewanella intestini]MRG35451.1 OmcA/MtrC family decaheme c-type cytochrome [Shewanella sp. XMDDZSB0408]